MVNIICHFISGADFPTVRRIIIFSSKQSMVLYWNSGVDVWGVFDSLTTAAVSGLCLVQRILSHICTWVKLLSAWCDHPSIDWYAVMLQMFSRQGRGRSVLDTCATIFQYIVSLIWIDIANSVKLSTFHHYNTFVIVCVRY